MYTENMNEINTDDMQETGGSAIGDAAESDKETLFFDNVMTALAAASPEGSTIRVIGFERADKFLRAGYKVVEGDADVTIARGGEREFALARTTDAEKLILFPTRDYAAAAVAEYRTQDKTFAYMRRGRKPFAAVFDENDIDNNLASIFGEIISLDLAAFDMMFGAYMRGERQTDVTENAAKLVTELTAKLKPLEKDSIKQRHALIDACKTAARLTERAPALLHGSGAAQTAEALRMLCSAEDRAVGMRGETEMLLGAYVIDFYIKSLISLRPEFPPNNNKRIDSVCEYFRADLRRACVYVSPLFAPEKLRLCEYRIGEFRSENLKRLYALSARQKAAWQVFKRLYPDDGYSLKTLVDKTDIGICLALAPDVFSADTMLSYLKQTGKLEKYIV